MKTLEGVRFREIRRPIISKQFLKVVVSFTFISLVLFGIFFILDDISRVEYMEETIEQSTRLTIRHFKANERLNQESHTLIRVIRHSMYPPSDEPYHLHTAFPVQAHALERAVRQITNAASRGIFVEVGAGDGETRSPTLCLEMEDNWTGLLIEANPEKWETLKKKNRKAYLSLSCVGFHNYSYVDDIYKRKNLSYLKKEEKHEIPNYKKEGNNIISAECYPLYSHLLAFGTTIVDFLVINIKSHRREILESLNWDKVDIKIIAVQTDRDEENPTIQNHLEKIGYKFKKVYSQNSEFFELYVQHNTKSKPRHTLGISTFHFFF